MGPSQTHLPIDRQGLWSRSTKIQFYPVHNPSLAEPNVLNISVVFPRGRRLPKRTAQFPHPEPPFLLSSIFPKRGWSCSSGAGDNNQHGVRHGRRANNDG